MALGPTAPVRAQYSGFYQEEPPTAAAPHPAPTPTPPAAGRLSLSLTAVPPGGAPSRFPLTVAAGASLPIRVTVASTGPSPGRVRVAAMALDDRAGTVAPSRTTLSGTGAWTTTFRAGQGDGSYQLLFVAQDPSGAASAASALATVRVMSGTPVLVAGPTLFEPVKDSLELRARNRSWRRAVALRTTLSPRWVDEVAEGLVSSPQYRATVAEAVKLDRERIALLGAWPDMTSFESYAKLEPVMSRYWADGGITLSTATANQAGNVFLAWRRGAGATVTMSEEVAQSLGVGARVVNTGNVLNGVGAAMIMLDFWANMSNAGNPAEAREAWYKAGYSSLDLYLSNVVADTFGAAAALPGMFTSYILTNAYDTLIGGHKQCWFNKMIEQAVAEDYLSDDLGDSRVVSKVMAAMQSPRGLRGTLLDWWADEAPTWAGWMGGCGSWNLAEARGYREEFVDRLMRSAEVVVNGRTFRPWAFYYGVSRRLVREREKQLARETAADLRDLEGAYLTRLHTTFYEAPLRLAVGGGAGAAIPGAIVRPEGWDAGRGWRTDGSGAVTIRVRGDDVSPAGTLLLRVRTPARGAWLFELPATALTEVSP